MKQPSISLSSLSQQGNYCVIDCGNTCAQIVDFENGKIVHKTQISISEKEKLWNHLKMKVNATSILSSVLNEQDTNKIITVLQPDLILGAKTPLPISLSGYKTPKTLGADRIANGVAGNFLSKTKNTLIIDVGTCIKFDLIQEGIYQGGSISPGYHLRLKAMHDYTGKLPLLEKKAPTPIIGKNTNECILSGVMYGIQYEICSFVEFYSKRHKDLTIFLTGGDHNMVAENLKNEIFVKENLTIYGLYLILLHNV